MHKETITENLACSLTEDHRQAYRQEMALTMLEANRLETEIAYLKKHYKEGIDPLKERIKELIALLETEVVTQPVICEVQHDHTTKKVRVYRCDTWEVIRERDMSPEECQLPLLDEAV